MVSGWFSWIFMVFSCFFFLKFTIVNDAISLLNVQIQDQCFWGSLTIVCNYFRWSTTIHPAMRCISNEICTNRGKATWALFSFFAVDLCWTVSQRKAVKNLTFFILLYLSIFIHFDLFCKLCWKGVAHEKLLFSLDKYKWSGAKAIWSWSEIGQNGELCSWSTNIKWVGQKLEIFGKLWLSF